MAKVKLAAWPRAPAARRGSWPRGSAGPDPIEPFDLELREGEVVGLAGLLGSGRTEVADLLFGIDKPDSGTITVDGKPVHHFSPLHSIGRGVALCPEDREGRGDRRRPDRAREHRPGRAGGPGLAAATSALRAQYAIADEYIKLLQDRDAIDADQLVGNLSGGNQQKVILARWLATNPQVLILDEPTRGIDIGAKAEVQRLVLDTRRRGQVVRLHLVGAGGGPAHEPSDRGAPRPGQGDRVRGRGRRAGDHAGDGGGRP